MRASRRATVRVFPRILRDVRLRSSCYGGKRSGQQQDILLHSRGSFRPRFSNSLRPLQTEGAGNAGCALHPRSHVQWVKKCAHEHTGQRRASDIPCAMALRLITCSPRRTALLPPSRPEKLLPPGALTPAPRRQDHTSLPYASAALVSRSFRVHRIPVPRS